MSDFQVGRRSVCAFGGFALLNLAFGGGCSQQETPPAATTSSSAEPNPMPEPAKPASLSVEQFTGRQEASLFAKSPVYAEFGNLKLNDMAVRIRVPFHIETDDMQRIPGVVYEKMDYPRDDSPAALAEAFQNLVAESDASKALNCRAVIHPEVLGPMQNLADQFYGESDVTAADYDREFAAHGKVAGVGLRLAEDAYIFGSVVQTLVSEIPRHHAKLQQAVRAAATRLPTEQLDALCTQLGDQLPGGVPTKSFVLGEALTQAMFGKYSHSSVNFPDLLPQLLASGTADEFLDGLRGAGLNINGFYAQAVIT